MSHSNIFRAVAEGILTDNPHLVLLFYLAQLFLRELIKSHRLVQIIPMDMSGYYGEPYTDLIGWLIFNVQFRSDNRAGPSNLGNVISQILLCKQITPDFNQEELCSINKDSQEIGKIISELQEFMPQQEIYLGRSGCFASYILFYQQILHSFLFYFTPPERWDKKTQQKKLNIWRPEGVLSQHQMVFVFSSFIYSREWILWLSPGKLSIWSDGSCIIFSVFSETFQQIFSIFPKKKQKNQLH